MFTVYLRLFWSFFQIGLFCFGGGMAALPLIQDQMVTVTGWMTLPAFTDLIAISEMTPGPIAVNAASFVGMQIAGFGGAIAATVGCVLPSCLIVSLLARLYQKYGDAPVIKGILAGLRPTVTALIFSAWLSVASLAFFHTDTIRLPFAPDGMALLLFCAALFLLRKKKTDAVAVIFGCGLVGGAYYFLTANQ